MSSLKQKHRELWVVSSPRVGIPKAPTIISPFVARKSKPHETVSFHIPPGFKIRDSSPIPNGPVVNKNRESSPVHIPTGFEIRENSPIHLPATFKIRENSPETV